MVLGLHGWEGFPGKLDIGRKVPCWVYVYSLSPVFLILFVTSPLLVDRGYSFRVIVYTNFIGNGSVFLYLNVGL